MIFSSAGALSVMFILFQTSETAFCCKQYIISGLLRHTFSRTVLSEKTIIMRKGKQAFRSIITGTPA
ncbi:hypothetical protein BEI62_03470 [Eisenbergiella tayi]|nr:hypothetical protein BEI62_03470 [Eisenbergiella tayi]